MSGYYTYYSEGFFGFGPPGTFRPYTIMHFAPILLCVVCIMLAWRKRDALMSWEKEPRLRYVLAACMLSMEFGFFLWLLYVGDTSGNYLMMSKLPLHTCDMGLMVCVFMVLSRNKTLFGINFFVTLFGASLACIIPQAVLDCADPAYFRYYQYFGEHLVPIFCTVYMIIVHSMKPRYRDIWIAAASLAVMLIPSFKLNEAFPGSDYLFLKLDTSLFPENQYARAVIYMVIIIIVFHAMWLLWRFAVRKWDCFRREESAGTSLDSPILPTIDEFAEMCYNGNKETKRKLRG